MSRLNLPSISTSTTTTTAYATDDEEDEEDNLPYPTELPRSDFLNPDFNAQEYLSSLSNRHQALEDLRSDLRARSQLLNQELLDLVNGNYEEFLSLGAELNGGEEKVEGVRIGLLGFTKEIEALKAVVSTREGEYAGLLTEAKQVRREIVFGRKLLEIEASLEALEDSLGITGTEALEDEDDESDDEVDGDEDGTTDDFARAVRRLNRRIEQYSVLDEQIRSVEAGQPFIESLRPRLDNARKTLLPDLSAALRQAKATKQSENQFTLTRMFGDINATTDALQILKAK